MQYVKIILTNLEYTLETVLLSSKAIISKMLNYRVKLIHVYEVSNCYVIRLR